MKLSLPNDSRALYEIAKTILLSSPVYREAANLGPTASLRATVDLHADGLHNTQQEQYINECITRNILPGSAVGLKYSRNIGAFVPTHTSMDHSALWMQPRTSDMEVMLLRGGRFWRINLTNQDCGGSYRDEILELMGKKIDILFRHGYVPSHASIEIDERQFHGGITMSLEQGGMYVNTNNDDVNTTLRRWANDTILERVI
jgi:hypothetical protein